ncbi:glycosyltransferase [Candidatus Gracilibacteria bacterium]|nr:glycosyltransferase [Candidatus Gracilibacteria bacterium]
MTVFLLSLFLHPILPLPQVFRDIVSQHGLHRALVPPSIVPSPIHKKILVRSETGGIIPENRKIYAFGVEWDDASYASLEQNKENINTLIMEELSLSDSGMMMLAPDKFKRTQQYLTQNDPDLSIYALINNYNQISGIWDTDILYGILSDETKRKNLETELKDFATLHNLGGINIDFEELDTKTIPYYLIFLEELGSQLHGVGKILSVNVPLSNDNFDLAEINKSVDLIFLMAYDEHWSSAVPGPIASQDWLIDGVGTAMNQVPKEKLVVTLGNYGYDWTLGKKQSTALTFQEAHTIMRESDESIVFDSGSLNPMYSYTDEQNKEHEVWYLDAVTAYDELSAMESLGIGNISLWRLGSEDPSIWNIFRQPASQRNAKNIENFGYGYEIDYEGTGEFYKLQSKPTLGKRRLSFSGIVVTKEAIDTFPMPYIIARYGNIVDKKIALTFDDGPDINFTPRILDILKQENIKSTFFIIGENSEKYPEVVKRIYDEGHILGNHSFSHPDISKIGHLRTDFELVSTERIIESITKHKTILWRPPYAEDIEPETPSQVQPLINSKALGYITVGMKIDPNDWMNPGVDMIVERVIEQVQSGRGNIVLLHDAGSDRSETILALPILIKKLKKLNYQIVGLNELLGSSRDDIMPAVVGNDAIFQNVNHTSFSMFSLFMWCIYYIFIATLVFGLLRLILILIFAVVEKYHYTPQRIYDPSKNISVSVIVPAYNEAKVIEKTIDSLLLSTYPYFDIIVVDDGSTDNTSGIVQDKYGNNPKIRLLTKGNTGKGNSMNYAIEHTIADIVIVIDSDTIFATDTIGMLTRHFFDPSVGAVSGNVVVGNRENLLTYLQALEYNTSQNLDRRAYDAMNIITVVPGAVGAWRRETVIELGGFSHDTLAEDSDMTISILRAGYRIHHEEYAYAYTEVPTTWRVFAKQRFRWAFGVLQVTWKHIDAIFARDTPIALRLFIFPSFIIYQIIVPIIAPLFDSFTIIMVAINMVSYFLYDSGVYVETLLHVLSYSVLFLILDFLIAYTAIAFEKNESWKLLIYFLPQRILYRFFMYYINIRALWNGMKGGAIGWGKFERTGTVERKSGKKENSEYGIIK